jgi:hypothetical protein
MPVFKEYFQRHQELAGIMAQETIIPVITLLVAIILEVVTPEITIQGIRETIKPVIQEVTQLEILQPEVVLSLGWA